MLSGREQAELTGQRLASLGLKYDVLIHSSMTRATETARIISKHLPGDGPCLQAARSPACPGVGVRATTPVLSVCSGVELSSCDLLREGAPIEPVPPVTHWKPEAVVRESSAVAPSFSSPSRLLQGRGGGGVSKMRSPSRTRFANETPPSFLARA